MPPLDLNLLPLMRRAGQDQSSLPGLYAVNPPRRAARGRSSDQLILYLTMMGNAPLPDEQHHQLLTRAAQTYYQTPGTVTSAARMAIELINQYLLDRNLRGSGGGRQGAGLLIVAVVRDGRLYLALGGPAHAFLLTTDQTAAQEFYDPENAGRPLGLSSTLSIRYYQTELHPADLVLLTALPPASWNATTLQSAYSQGLESVRRRLLGLAGSDVNAILMQFQPGSGKMRLLWPKSAGREMIATPPSPAVKIEPAIPSTEISGSVVSPDTGVSGDTTTAPEAKPVDLSTPMASPAPDDKTPVEVERPTMAVATATTSAVPGSGKSAEYPAASVATPRRLNDIPPRSASKRKAALPTFPRLNTAPLRKGLGLAGLAATRFGRGILIFIKRLLPDESLFSIPTSTMIFLAVAVPLVVAIAGVMVYLDRGRAAQAQVYYQKSLEMAAQAQAQTDPLLQRAAWQETLDLISTAVAYKDMPDAKTLQTQASAALDQLDRVRRLEFQPAVQPLGETAIVTRMVAMQDELYLLNGSQGSVRRAVLTSRGYIIDPNFRCGPGPYGSRLVGKLIDIAPLPKGSEFNATLLGLDEAANLLYCIPHEEPKAISLATPVVSGWGQITAFAFDQDTQNLYVLDNVKRKLWIYQGLKITEQPISFFDETVDVLPNLENITYLAANRTTLYFLHQDGQLTVCEYARQEGSVARCQDPVTYLDDRPGRQNGNLIAETQFAGIQYASPPDPSIFMLDTSHQAVYQFSLAMNFYSQYRSSTAIPSAAATAFTISPDRIVFMAINNQVFYARLMP